MNNQPLVSIVAVCYNHAQFVVETLDSIKAQTYPNIELLILDDCSSDDSVAVIKGWIKCSDYDCTFIAHQENQGICKTFNEGIRLVSGDYYQVLACDDVLLLDKIRLQVNCFLTNKDLTLVHSASCKINDRSEVIEELFVLNSYNKQGVQNDFEEMISLVVAGNIVIAPSVLIKTESLPPQPVYPEKFFFEDLYLILFFLTNRKIFYYIEEPLVKYRELETSVMRSTKHKAKLKSDRNKILLEFLGYSEKIDKKILRKAKNNITTSDLISFFIKKRLSIRNILYSLRQKAIFKAFEM